MIIKYNTYIKESLNTKESISIKDIIVYIKSLLPENTNVNVNLKYGNEVSVYLKEYKLNNFTIYYDEYSKYYKFIQYFVDDESEDFLNINELKDYIKLFMNEFYYKNLKNFILIEKNGLYLKYIPFFNNKTYNKLILSILDHDDTYVTQLKDILQYLDVSILHRYKYYIDANNFNLI